MSRPGGDVQPSHRSAPPSAQWEGVPEVLWITHIGTSPCAATNSLWRVLDERLCRPERVVLLCTPNDPRVQEPIRRARHTVSVLGRHYLGHEPGLEVLPCDENSPEDTITKARQALGMARAIGIKAAVDITAGRKYMSAFLALAAHEDADNVHAVYYNHLLDVSFGQVDYPLIPEALHELRDLFELLHDTRTQPNQ